MAERLGVNEFPSCHGGLENLDQEFDYIIDSVEGDVPTILKAPSFGMGRPPAYWRYKIWALV